MARWTREQVLKAAPDDSSVKAARGLAKPGPWSDMGSTDTLVWGKCQGSGKTPYQVSIDLTGPAYRCSCPSRKFPCKHALALLLLWVEGDGSVAHLDQPAGFAAEWADKRRTPTSRPQREIDPEAQARRREARLATMTTGMEEFATWLNDLVRSGLAAARQQSYAWWDGAAARLVDRQLPGLAEQVREAGSWVGAGGDGWVDRLVTTAGSWWAATQAWQRAAYLDAHELGDLRILLGWPYSTEEIRAGDRLDDTWIVLGAHRTDDGRLQQQRTWLQGRATGETVQVLDFAAGGAGLPLPQVVGAELTGPVSRYPGHAPRRALLGDPITAGGPVSHLPVGGSVEAALDTMAAGLADNPWCRRMPVLLADVIVTPEHVVDAAGHALPITPDTAVWSLLAHSGGHPCDLFAELEDGRLRVLSAGIEGGVIAL